MEITKIHKRKCTWHIDCTHQHFTLTQKLSTSYEKVMKCKEKQNKRFTQKKSCHRVRLKLLARSHGFVAILLYN